MLVAKATAQFLKAAPKQMLIVAFIIRLLVRVTGFLSAFCMFLLVALTFADVIMRYFFSAPIPGVTDHVSIILGFVLFSGIPMVTHSVGDIKVGALVPYYPERLKFWEKRISVVVTFLMMGFVALIVFRHAISLNRIGTFTEALNWNVALIVFLLGLLVAVAAVVAAHRIFLVFAGQDIEEHQGSRE